MHAIALVIFIRFVDLLLNVVVDFFRFYTLLVLSTALFGKPPFKNVIVNGLVLAR